MKFLAFYNLHQHGNTTTKWFINSKLISELDERRKMFIFYKLHSLIQCSELVMIPFRITGIMYSIYKEEKKRKAQENTDHSYDDDGKEVAFLSGERISKYVGRI